MLKSDPTPPHSPDRRTPLIVFGIWAVSVALAMGLIALYAENVPFADEWEAIPQLTRHRPADFSWFVQRHNEHRIPIPRLIFYGLFRLTDDLRTAMYFNVAVLASTALALILVAKKVRGYLRRSDAVFPLLLLNLGNWENIIWGWQVQYSMSISLSLVFLICLVLQRERPTFPGTLTAGMALILMPICGANGSLCSLVLATWLFAAGAWQLVFRNRGVGLLGMILALLALAMAASCWITPAKSALVRIRQFWPWYWLENLGEYFSVSFGPPYLTTASSTPGFLFTLWPLWAAVGLLFVVASIWKCIKLTPDERMHALGFLTICAAMVGMQIAVASFRPIPYGVHLFSKEPATVFSSRYALVFVPLPLALYFFWERYGGRRGRALVQTALFGMALLSVLYIPTALNAARDRQEVLVAFLEEARSYEPAALVANHQSPCVLVPGAQDRLTDFISELRDHWRRRGATR
jgi:hypothetical protein